MGEWDPEVMTDPFPTAIASLTGMKVVQVAAGSNCAMVLIEDGSLFEWGLAARDLVQPRPDTARHIIPRKVEGIPPAKYVARNTRGGTVVVSRDEGRLYVWGHGGMGLGDTKRGAVLTEPTLVPRVKDVVKASVDGDTTLVVDKFGRVAWTGVFFDKPRSSRIAEKHIFTAWTALGRVVDIHAGEVSAAVNVEGHVYYWSAEIKGEEDEICFPRATSPCRYTQGLEGHKIIGVSGGLESLRLLTDAGLVLSWGNSCGGSLGHGHDGFLSDPDWGIGSVSTPTVVSAAAKEGKVHQIVSGLSSYALAYASGKVATGGPNGELVFQHNEELGETEQLADPIWHQFNNLGLGPDVRFALVPTLLADPVRAALD